MPANYDNVNAVWPQDPPVPTAQEALTGARKLVRLALTLGPDGTRLKFRGEFKLTSGRRYTWTRRGVFYVNPDQREWNVGRGWQTIVHDIAHWAGRRLYPGAKPHDHRTAFIERKLAEHVVGSGWLEGKLKRLEKPPAPIDLKVERAKRVAARIIAWERKLKRSETALRKLRRQQRYYEKGRGQ
jgi:hypothetical protein